MKEQQQKDYQMAEDPFSQFMFGPSKQASSNTPYPSSFDYEEIMVNIDKLITSGEKLKPVFKQIIPFIRQLKNKI